jgi:hypothetical protein
MISACANEKLPSPIKSILSVGVNGMVGRRAGAFPLPLCFVLSSAASAACAAFSLFLSRVCWDCKVAFKDVFFLCPMATLDSRNNQLINVRKWNQLNIDSEFYAIAPDLIRLCPGVRRSERRALYNAAICMPSLDSASSEFSLSGFTSHATVFMSQCRIQVLQLLVWSQSCHCQESRLNRLTHIFTSSVHQPRFHRYASPLQVYSVLVPHYKGCGHHGEPCFHVTE